jgi:hypothetical protein
MNARSSHLKTRLIVSPNHNILHEIWGPYRHTKSIPDPVLVLMTQSGSGPRRKEVTYRN